MNDIADSLNKLKGNIISSALKGDLSKAILTKFAFIKFPNDINTKNIAVREASQGIIKMFKNYDTCFKEYKDLSSQADSVELFFKFINNPKIVAEDQNVNLDLLKFNKCFSDKNDATFNGLGKEYIESIIYIHNNPKLQNEMIKYCQASSESDRSSNYICSMEGFNAAIKLVDPKAMSFSEII